MFNVAICDDDKNFIQYVEDIIKELGYAEDVKFFEYLSGEEFLFDIDERGDLDLVVLDIQMGETDGNQVSVELRKRYKSTTLVFCSGYFKPSPENIKVSPFRFLLKEYSRERMVSEFKEIFEYLTNNKDEPSIVCRGERSQVQVYANEIMYIEISKRGIKYNFSTLILYSVVLFCHIARNPVNTMTLGYFRFVLLCVAYCKNNINI